MKKILLCFLLFSNIVTCMNDDEKTKQKLFARKKVSIIHNSVLCNCSYLATPFYIHNGKSLYYKSLSKSVSDYSFTMLRLIDLQKARNEHYQEFLNCIKKCSEND